MEGLKAHRKIAEVNWLSVVSGIDRNGEERGGEGGGLVLSRQVEQSIILSLICSYDFFASGVISDAPEELRGIGISQNETPEFWPPKAISTSFQYFPPLRDELRHPPFRHSTRFPDFATSHRSSRVSVLPGCLQSLFILPPPISFSNWIVLFSVLEK
ncbi:hypothetical protein CDAR_216361 [Caerostris darwini]|uniref:Uncharacterized protein n=1 Tax=Caerostris darwini TaxID=1538125 RepID=A0AAV4U340_9ARAC|nr:hypothetical protein CDAR_216361 [Caerostris darwini]